MCYSGACPYEDYSGECTLGHRPVYPDDAACVIPVNGPNEEPDHV